MEQDGSVSYGFDAYEEAKAYAERMVSENWRYKEIYITKTIARVKGIHKVVFLEEEDVEGALGRIATALKETLRMMD